MADHLYEVQTEETSFLGCQRVGAHIRTTARIVTCIYRNDETGFSVYDVENEEGRWLKINGYFPTKLRYDNYYKFQGAVKDGKYGRILQVEKYESVLPETEDGILMVLRTLPKLDTRASAVYQELGDEALDIILTDPDQVCRRVKWAGPKLVSAWQEQLRQLKEEDVTIQILQEYKIPPAAAKGLLEKFPDIIERLKASPYFLMEEIPGYGFKDCDRIALDNGYPVDGQERLQQAMLSVLKQAAIARGDCYMPEDEFWSQVSRLVDIRADAQAVQQCLSGPGQGHVTIGKRDWPVDRAALSASFAAWQASARRKPFYWTCAAVPDTALREALASMRGEAVKEEDRVYLGYMYRAEQETASKLKAMSASEYGAFPDVEEVLDEVCKEIGCTLEEKQRAAVLLICRAMGGVFVLDGRAGCGKTFTLDIIVKMLERLYERQGRAFTAKIMAPTGKAAQVAHDSTGLPASTIHKALHLVVDKTSTEAVTVQGDCVVVDESSMMGLMLFATLIRAVPSGTKLIIMGDHEQLPSIEAGNVLKDIIDSGAVPVVSLDVVKRQAEGSGILYNANQILDGHPIRSRVTEGRGLRDNAYLYRVQDEISCRDKIVEMYRRLRKIGAKADDIQILCPQKKTEVGIDALNYFIQQISTPAGGLEQFSKDIDIHGPDGTIQRKKLMLRRGDKVVNMVNDREMRYYNWSKGAGFTEDLLYTGIVNGEVGRIAAIMDVKDGKLTRRHIYVRYGQDRYARYVDDVSALSLAYAMTIHRAQGSQWPIVIAPIMSCNRRMLDRKLFYTLYTRAQTTSIIFGDETAIQYAVENDPSGGRRTWLKERLQSDSPLS